MKLKVLTANIAFGIPNMDNLMVNLRAHTKFHNWKVFPFWITQGRFKKLFKYKASSNQKRLEYLQTKSRLKGVLDMVRCYSPDLLILNELIYQVHQGIIKDLKALGFVDFAWGKSGHYKEATVSTLVASKFPALKEGLGLRVSQGSTMGSGAGATGLRLAGYPVTFIGFQLGIFDQKLWDRQMTAVADFVLQEQSRGRQTILGGDFNATDQQIKKAKGFSNLAFRTVNHKHLATGPVCLPLQWDLDHVFVPRDWLVSDTKVIDFGSDHRAIFSELKTIF